MMKVDANPPRVKALLFQNPDISHEVFQAFWTLDTTIKKKHLQKPHPIKPPSLSTFPNGKKIHQSQHLCALPGKKFRSGYNIPGCAFTAGAEEMASSIIAVRNKCQVGN